MNPTREMKRGESPEAQIVLNLIRNRRVTRHYLPGEVDRDKLLLLVDAASWALGEIGGEDAHSILQHAQGTLTNEDLVEAIDDALASASLRDGLLELPLDDMLDDGTLE